MFDSPHAFEPLLNSEQAAALVKVHPKTLQRYARNGLVAGLRLGKGCHQGGFWRSVDESEINLLMLKLPQQLDRILRHNLNLKIAVQLQLNRLRKFNQTRGHIRRRADSEFMALATLGLPCLMNSTMEKVNTLPDMLNESASRCGDRRAAIFPDEELYLHDLLNQHQALAESGFSESDTLCGFG